MTNEINFKELYEVSLKTTYPIEVEGEIVETGETIAFFDKIQIANFQEIKNVAKAEGGYGNYAHILWETTKEIRISLSQGIFSKSQFALMSNAKLAKKANNELVRINSRKEFESNDLGEINIGQSLQDPI